jgi:hypothetical protein
MLAQSDGVRAALVGLLAPAEIVRAQRAAHPRFTPDGKTILFIRASTKTWDTPPRHLYALELASGREIPVLTKRDIYTRPSLQP